jgi:hypothetical protein
MAFNLERGQAHLSNLQIYLGLNSQFQAEWHSIFGGGRNTEQQ